MITIIMTLLLPLTASLFPFILFPLPLPSLLFLPPSHSSNSSPSSLSNYCIIFPILGVKYPTKDTIHNDGGDAYSNFNTGQ